MRTFTRFFMGDTEPDARNEARMWSKPGQIGDITRVVDISDQLEAKVAHGLGGPLQQGLGSQVVAGTRVWAVTQQVAVQRVVGHAWPEEHDASCGFKAAMVPGRNVARGLDPEHCSRCTDLVRLLNEAQEARLDRWGRLLTEQPPARPGESPAAFSSRMLGGRDV